MDRPGWRWSGGYPDRTGECVVLQTPKAIDAEAWKWRKNYRVWEANRKVFLYPENWIEPELRLDKSPFFRELETDIMKGEPNEENLERAVKTYLDKLVDIGRLEVISMYWEDEVDVLHVFARTLSPPYRYFYRRLLDRREWMAWERVPLDLPITTTGAHLVPVVYNRRLYLFWPVFRVASENGAGQLPVTGLEQVSGWKIGLEWSEYRSGRWSAKRVGPTTISQTAMTAPASHTLRAVRMGSDLIIKVVVGVNGDFVGSFSLQECAGTVLAGEAQPGDAGGIASPRGGLKYMTFDSGPNPWVRPVGQSHAVENYFDLGFSRGEDARGVLARIPAAYRVVYPHQIENGQLPDSFRYFFFPFFFEDNRRTYFALPSGGKAATSRFPPETFGNTDVMLALTYTYLNAPMNWQPADVVEADALDLKLKPQDGGQNASFQMQVANFEQLRFSSFWRPYFRSFVKSLESRGLPGLLTLDNQKLKADQRPGSFFKNHYNPTDWVALGRLPRYEVDFTIEGAYAPYNWELFFHAPFLVACHLSRNGQYEDAQRWFHFIFNPTIDTPVAQNEAPWKRFWQVLPLREEGPAISAHEMLELLSYDGNDTGLLTRKYEVEDQIRQWVAYPFQPHRIARLRLAAYRKAVVRKYLDNLVAWADTLFARHTRESVQEATQLYLLAAGVLGQRPERIPAKATVAPMTYEQMQAQGLDDFSNLVTAEHVIFPFAGTELGTAPASRSSTRVRRSTSARHPTISS
jgi:hypothetical protein